MMHLSHFITYISTAKQPVREYNVSTNGNKRGCDIYLPPNTEYEFGFKNQLNLRRRIDISIDGQKSIDSLIVSKYQEISLERFFDTNKKFKTALKSDSKVSDPTNPNIGKIKIEVYTENEPPSQPYKSLLRGANADYTIDQGGIHHTVYQCNMSQDVLGVSSLKASNLATVEGNDSDQKLFTTNWWGDMQSELLVFEYNLLEKNAELQSTTHKFCTSCGSKSELDHKFCAKCGKKF